MLAFNTRQCGLVRLRVNAHQEIVGTTASRIDVYSVPKHAQK
jgi:hypothetical protein